MKPEPNFQKILKRKIKHYGKTEAAYEFAASEFASEVISGSMSLDSPLCRFKNPIDICVITDVYEAMVDYKNENSKNQQRQLAVSCKLIKTILINAFKL